MSAEKRRGQWKAAFGWWDVESSGRTTSEDESCPTPNQYPASPQRYMEEKKTQRKRENTKTGEIFISEESRHTWRTDDVIRTGR